MRWPSILILATACGCGGIPSYAASAFDANDEGWTLGGNGSDTRPTLSGVGGNPGGHICGTDAVQGDIWYFIAPDKFLGDASRVYGTRLTWDLKQSQMYQQLKGRDAILQGGGLSIIFNIKQTPAEEWTPYSVRLDDTSGWRIDDVDQAVATEQDIRTVLGHVTSLRLRGEFVDGPDTECLDNVYFGVK